MTDVDHTSFRDDVGAFLLGALTDPEREAFERHLAECEECRLEVDRLRPAADLLPRSVEQMEPPASLKRSLMAVVDSEARERPGAAERAGPTLGERLRGLFSGPMLSLIHISEPTRQKLISYAVFCLKKFFFNDTATTEIYT